MIGRGCRLLGGDMPVWFSGRMPASQAGGAGPIPVTGSMAPSETRAGFLPFILTARKDGKCLGEWG